MTNYTGYAPEVAATIYNVQLYRDLERYQSGLLTCCVCGGTWNPREDEGGREIWVRRIKASKYICPHCWDNAEESEEED